jgi:Ca2+-binding RTX toxin-like protein
MSRSSRSRLATAALVTALVPLFWGWSPSASAQSQSVNNGLIATEWQYQVRAMNPDGTSVHVLASTNDTAALRFSSPAWSPDGTQVAFERTGQLWVANMDGTGMRAVSDTPGPEYNPAWSPDGSRLAFMRDGAIWVVNADGTREHQVTTMCCNDYPTWSPDGTKIAFESYRSGLWQVHVLDLAVGEPALQLTESGGANRWPDWSPDGSQIVFVSGRRQDSADLWVMNTDGTAETALTALSGGEKYPSWSPDGQQVAYSRAAEVAVIGRDGSGDHDLGVLGQEPDWQPLPPCTVTGSEASEALVGTDQADVLCGEGGDDMISGAAGDDVVIGGAGSDTVCLGSGASGVEVDLQRTMSSGEGNDLVLLIENACAGNGDDILRGNELANGLSGAGGEDQIDGRLGADALDGGTGRDTVIFSLVGGVNVDLAAGTAVTNAGTDAVVGFEDVVGTAGFDRIIGDSGDNRLQGGSGGDDAFLGRMGDDTVIASADGGSILYREASSGVDVDLASGVATGEGSDTLIAVTGVSGSPYADVIRGPVSGSRGNWLSGLAGNDVIVSNLPEHSLLEGGEGEDALILTGMPNAVTVDITRGSLTPQGRSSFPATNFEQVVGTRFGDMIIGSPGRDLLRGESGADRILPGPANDVVRGGPGPDVVSFASATRSITVDLREGFAVGQGTDSIAGLENVLGSPYADQLSGNAAANRLDGGAGPDDGLGRGGVDVLIGGLGSDDLLGGSDSDRLLARDGVADDLDGGTGTDTCLVDQRDLVRRCP